MVIFYRKYGYLCREVTIVPRQGGTPSLMLLPAEEYGMKEATTATTVTISFVIFKAPTSYLAAQIHSEAIILLHRTRFRFRHRT